MKSALSLLHLLAFSVSVLAQETDPATTAAQIDRLISSSEVDSFTSIDDATFLRRVSLDLIGRPPTPAEITRFGLNPAGNKRSELVQQLLEESEYAESWAFYWRDAIFGRATNQRAGLVRSAFEEWIAEEFAANTPWDEIVTDLLTAHGPVNDDGSSALIFAHEGEPEEIAAEASRLFLGIQMQCANCHDHPWDRWKREQFHELVAFFPRVSVRRNRESDNMFDYEIASVDRDPQRRTGMTTFFLTRIDKNKDNFISEAESMNSPLSRLFRDEVKKRIDKNGDGRISVFELKNAQPSDNNRPGRGAIEHYMPDLSDPGSDGKMVQPKFFATNASARQGMTDLERRQTVARMFTSKGNEWFAKAIVNRIWSELTATAFYSPIDDIGPDRSAQHADALEVLSTGFVASGYDLKWLFSTITATRVYQRAINTNAEGFVRFEPVRLRSDQLYNAVLQALNVDSLPLNFTGRRGGAYGGNRARIQFGTVFGFDPSTPRDELTGSIPEALFMMNSIQIHQFIQSTDPNSTINRISNSVVSDSDVIHELYVVALGREPLPEEVRLAMSYLSDATTRREGLEDLLWALLNTSEFQSKR